jgi:hypothetical protein
MLNKPSLGNGFEFTLMTRKRTLPSVFSTSVIDQYVFSKTSILTKLTLKSRFLEVYSLNMHLQVCSLTSRVIAIFTREGFHT